jgi:hypothetical protein
LWSNDIITPSDLTEEEVKWMWFARQELREFKNTARLNVIGFRKENALYLNDFSVVFHNCSSESNYHVQSLLRTKSAQRFLETTITTSSSSTECIRGLEGFSHPIVREHRMIHVQKLLAVQALACAERREQLCRSVSISSSRASRVLGRLLGHGDAIAVARIVQEELEQI